MNQAEYRKKQEDAERKRHEASEHAERQQIIGALERIGEQNEATENQAQRADTFRRRAERLSRRLEKRRFYLDLAGTIGLWAAAAVGVVAVLVASSDSDKQRLEMHGQLEAIKGQLDEMKAQRLITIAQTRANLSRQNFIMSSVPLNKDGQQQFSGWQISPSWKNVGSTNATNFVGWFKILPLDKVIDAKELAEPNCPELPAPDAAFRIRTMTLPQGGPVTQLAQFLSIEDATAARNGQKVIVIIGHIEYRDIYYPATPIHHHDWCTNLIPHDIEHNVFSPVDISESVD